MIQNPNVPNDEGSTAALENQNKSRSENKLAFCCAIALMVVLVAFCALYIIGSKDKGDDGAAKKIVIESDEPSPLNLPPIIPSKKPSKKATKTSQYPRTTTVSLNTSDSNQNDSQLNNHTLETLEETRRTLTTTAETPFTGLSPDWASLKNCGEYQSAICAFDGQNTLMLPICSILVGRDKSGKSIELEDTIQVAQQRAYPYVADYIYLTKDNPVYDVDKLYSKFLSANVVIGALIDVTLDNIAMLANVCNLITSLKLRRLFVAVVFRDLIPGNVSINYEDIMQRGTDMLILHKTITRPTNNCEETRDYRLMVQAAFKQQIFLDRNKEFRTYVIEPIDSNSSSYLNVGIACGSCKQQNSVADDNCKLLESSKRNVVAIVATLQKSGDVTPQKGCGLDSAERHTH